MKTCLLLLLFGIGATAALAQSAGAPGRLDYSSFKIITDRNIFNPNRSPRTQARVIERQTKPSRRTYTAEAFALVGTLSSDQGTFAFFDGTLSEYRRAVQQADKIAGYKVTSIGHETVRLASATNVLDLPIGKQLKRDTTGGWVLTERTETVFVDAPRPTYTRSGSRDSAPETGPGPGPGPEAPGGVPAVVVMDPESGEVIAEDGPAMEEGAPAPGAAASTSQSKPAPGAAPESDVLRRLREKAARERGG